MILLSASNVPLGNNEPDQPWDLSPHYYEEVTLLFRLISYVIWVIQHVLI
jgi:hypothetical protein